MSCLCITLITAVLASWDCPRTSRAVTPTFTPATSSMPFNSNTTTRASASSFSTLKLVNLAPYSTACCLPTSMSTPLQLPIPQNPLGDGTHPLFANFDRGPRLNLSTPTGTVTRQLAATEAVALASVISTGAAFFLVHPSLFRNNGLQHRLHGKHGCHGFEQRDVARSVRRLQALLPV